MFGRFTSWSSANAALASVLRRFDAYPKPLDDFRIKTRFGGLMTITCALVMLLLFASEILDYVSTEVKEELIVDTTRSGKLKINLDVIFPHLTCDLLALDAMDVSGEQHIDIEHNVYKRRLNPDNLRPIDDEPPKKENVTSGSEGGSVKECGSCYGAETEEQKCCNTCSDIGKAYGKKSWHFDHRKFEQCKGLDGVEVTFNEACQIYGYLEVNRVSGSFHLAPRVKSFSFGNVHIHDLFPLSRKDLNTTHTVRHLSFGKQLEGHGLRKKMNPLDGIESVAAKPVTMFQYHIKIIPTLYARADQVFPSNEYSATRHSKSIESGGDGDTGILGVFFFYDFAPVMVKYSEKAKSLGHFVTGLCAIIGGVFTVTGLIDKLFYTSTRLWQEKMDLGKAT